MKYLGLLLLFVLGCPSEGGSPPPPPVPVPVPVPPPAPPPQPVPPPQPPPDTAVDTVVVVVPHDSVEMLVFPRWVLIGPGELRLLCVGWKFPSGHIAMRKEDATRLISVPPWGEPLGDGSPARPWTMAVGIDGKRGIILPGDTVYLRGSPRWCAKEYRTTFTKEEMAVTSGEQREADSRTGEAWASSDTSVIQVQAVPGSITAHQRYEKRRAAWVLNRSMTPDTSVDVFVAWHGQRAGAKVQVRVQGWYVAP